MSFQDRVKAFQDSLTEQQAVLLSNPADIQYFTDFDCLNPQEREPFCVITKNSITLLYPSFSPVNKMDFVRYHAGYWPSDLVSVLNDAGHKNVTECLIDTTSLFVNEYQELQGLKHLKLTSLDRTSVWNLRMQKDSEELMALTQAAQVTKKVMSLLHERLKLGMTELELALECEVLFKQHGSLQLAFPPVIAFGEHTALPHHQPTGFVLGKNMAVLVDIGAKIDDYCGDMTRTWWFGDKPDTEFVKIEKIVKAAYSAGVKAVCADCKGNEIDKVVRDEIDAAGYGKQFIHTTGHALGLEIHEQPSLYFKKESNLPLNSVVTVEPGIYLEGKFGYRYENTVIVEKDGCKEITL